MEIIFKNTSKKSNFKYCSDIFKGKKVLNGFNKLNYCPVGQDIYECGDVKFDKQITGNLYLDYPLSVVVKKEITFDSLYSLIKEIRKTYGEIYKNRESAIKYGIWGHDIYDLQIEGIQIYKDYSINVSIGS